MRDSASNPAVYEVQDAASATTTLRALGVHVECTDDHPSVDFSDCAKRSTGTPVLTLGWIKVHPDGQHAVSLHDLDDDLQALALESSARHFLTGDTGRPNWRCDVEEDGTEVTVLMASVSMATATRYLEARTLPDQVDRPGVCRKCDRRIRTYKFGEGGWVCPRHRVEPTTVNGLATRRLLQLAASIATYRQAARTAERAGDTDKAARENEVADIIARPLNFAWQVNEVLKTRTRRARKAVTQG